MQILGNGLHNGEACRLWLRSEDNDSVGLTLLPTLFTPLPPSPPSAATSSQPHLSPSLISEKRPFSQTMWKLAERGFWSSCDAALCDRSQTQIFSFPLKDPQLRRLLEKLLTVAVEIFYYTATSHYLYLSTSNRELDAWMGLCVNVSCACACVFVCI